MSVLDAVLQHKRIKQEQEQFNSKLLNDVLNQATSITNANRQNDLTREVQLARSGLKRDTVGNIIRAPELEDPLSDIARQNTLLEFQLNRRNAQDLGILAPTQTETVNQVLGSSEQLAGPVSAAQQAPVAPQQVELNSQAPLGSVMESATIMGRKITNLDALKEKEGIKAEGQTDAQRQKDVLKSTQDLLNAELKIDNQLDNFVDVAERTMDLTGVSPGILSGLASKVLGATKVNEFYAGFVGGEVEYAAAIGRMAIPGARAVRMVDLFKKSAPTSFDTIESGIQNSADSFRNALSTDMSRNPHQYLGIDKSVKVDRGHNEKLKQQLAEFERLFVDGMQRKVFERNPLLLKETTRRKLEQGDTIPEIKILSNERAG